MSQGADVNSLPDHRDKHFEGWSAARPSTMPPDLRRKVRRTRFKHSLTGKHAPEADPIRAVQETYVNEEPLHLTGDGSPSE